MKTRPSRLYGKAPNFPPASRLSRRLCPIHPLPLVEPLILTVPPGGGRSFPKNFSLGGSQKKVTVC